MDIEKLKELYATGDYVFYYEQKKFKTYVKALSPALDTWDLVPVREEHEYIADKVLANPDVEVEQKTNPHQGWIEDNNFFNNYQDWHEYRLKPQKPIFEDVPLELQKERCEKYYESIQTNSIEDLNELPKNGQMKTAKMYKQTLN